jgi:hypothetical protein
MITWTYRFTSRHLSSHRYMSMSGTTGPSGKDGKILTVEPYAWTTLANETAKQLPISCMPKHFLSDSKDKRLLPAWKLSDSDRNALFSKLESVAEIKSGLDHALVVLGIKHKKPLLFSWGSTAYGQTGNTLPNIVQMALFLDADFNPSPQPVAVISETKRKIQKIACGFFHNLCLESTDDTDFTSKGNRLWSWGAGFLGFGDEAYHVYPRLLNQQLEKSKILDCFASGYYSLIKTVSCNDSHPEYYFWGTLTDGGQTLSYKREALSSGRKSIINTIWDLLFPTIDSTPNMNSSNKSPMCFTSPILLPMISGKQYHSIHCHPSFILLMQDIKPSSRGIVKVDLLYSKDQPISAKNSTYERTYSPIFFGDGFHTTSDALVPELLSWKLSCSLNTKDASDSISSIHIPWIPKKNSNVMFDSIIFPLYILTSKYRLLCYDLTHVCNESSNSSHDPVYIWDLASISSCLEEAKDVLFLSTGASLNGDCLPQMHIYILSKIGEIFYFKILGNGDLIDKDENTIVSASNGVNNSSNLKPVFPGKWSRMTSNSIDMVYIW